MEFVRRVGPDPHEGGNQTPGASGCPDIWELSTGDFAIIGLRATAHLRECLPPTAGCGPDEEIVVLPRQQLLKAQTDLSKML